MQEFVHRNEVTLPRSHLSDIRPNTLSLHSTCSNENWSDKWQQDQEWMPVGPLFSIQVDPENMEGQFDITLPHVLHLTDAKELTTEDVRFLHVVGDSYELLPVTELTPSHAATRFMKSGVFGVLGKTQKAFSISRNSLLMAFARKDKSDISRLKVYMISNTWTMQKKLKEEENKENFALCGSMTCHLYPGIVYQLEGSVANGRDTFVSTSPQCLMYKDTFDANKLCEPFHVEVSAEIWNSSTTLQLHLELFKEAKDGAKEPVATLTLDDLPERCKQGYAEGSDSGHLTPSVDSVRHQHITDSLSQMMERLADQLDEANVQQLLEVCPLSSQLKREMQDSQKPSDLFKAMMTLGHIKEDNLTMLQRDMIAVGISWTALVRNIPVVPIHLRQPTVEEAFIGPKGGAVEIPHFLKLVVPDGALQQKTEVTLSIVDFPSLLIRSKGVHWTCDYPWPHAEAASSQEMLGKVLFSPAFHVDLHGAKLTGKVPVEVHTWRPSGTGHHKCIILHHDDITGWTDISAETETLITGNRLEIRLTQCSTIVPIWVPLVLFSSAISAAAISSSPLAPVVLSTAAVVTMGECLIAQILDRSKEGTFKCWFSTYIKPANNLQVQFHILCKDGTSQEALAYREGFVHCGDNRSQVFLFNGEYVDVHIRDASGEHEKTVPSVIMDADECRSSWGQQIQLTMPREQYMVGQVTVKRNKGTQDVCSLTFQQPPYLQSPQLSGSSQSDRRLLLELAACSLQPAQRHHWDAPPLGTSPDIAQDEGRGDSSQASGLSEMDVTNVHAQTLHPLEQNLPSGRCSVLLVSTEYGTSKGGISTINRQVARIFTAAGAEVYATVLEASQQDKRHAERDGVRLLKPRLDPDNSAKPSLEWLTVYHSVHFPHIPPDVCCIVGHVDVTSRAARKIKEERFPHAKLAMFGHVAPEETEHYKSDEKALGVGRKEASIQDDIGKTDVVFSVGPRIHRHYKRFLRRNHVTQHIFLPEPSMVFREADVTFGEEDEEGRKPERVILSIGRVRNVERLKGHDLAAGSIDKAAQRLDNQYTLRLRVRGIDENDFKDSKRILEEKLRSGRIKATLLPYGTQEEIRRDMEACHLVLMPSRAEPFGLVGLEAIAAGVPVLISEHSGLAELIEELSDRLGQPTFRHCIVKMKGDTETDADAEKWAERIEDVLKNARSEFAEARAFREKLLASKYWEESHQTFLQACGITDGPCTRAEGGGAESQV